VATIDMGLQVNVSVHSIGLSSSSLFY